MKCTFVVKFQAFYLNDTSVLDGNSLSKFIFDQVKVSLSIPGTPIDIIHIYTFDQDFVLPEFFIEDLCEVNAADSPVCYKPFNYTVNINNNYIYSNDFIMTLMKDKVNRSIKKIMQIKKRNDRRV